MTTLKKHAKFFKMRYLGGSSFKGGRLRTDKGESPRESVAGTNPLRIPSC